MTPVVYKLENVVKQYDGRPALSIEAMEIRERDVVAVLGPNGSGKTTLLNILAFLDVPSSGRVWFEGHQLNWVERDLHPFRRQVTLVTRPPTMFNTSALRNVTYGLRLRHVARIERRALARQALDKVGLPGFEHRSARSLSSGEAQRVALARAIVLKPQVLLLDEPTSNIHPDFVPQLEHVLRELVADNGTTIVFSTHDQTQAERLADRVIDLRDGKIDSDHQLSHMRSGTSL